MQLSSAPTGPGDAVDDVAGALVLLVRGLKELHAAVGDRVGLHVELPAFSALTVLLDHDTLPDHDRLRVSDLADLLRLDLSSVSRQVAALEREGWVERERDPADSRAQLLRVSDAGREVVQRVRADRAALLHELLPDWTDAQLRSFADLLRRFSADVAPAREAGMRSSLLAGRGGR